MLEDIRTTDKDEYWETLRQRWGALLSYRYIGRQFSSMNNVHDDTVTLRHDMRNAAGGILSQIYSISAPGGGGPSDLEVVPNPVIHSVQILDNDPFEYDEYFFVQLSGASAPVIITGDGVGMIYGEFGPYWPEF